MTNNIKNDLFECTVDTDGFALITIKMIHQPTNLFSIEFIQAYIRAATQLVQDEAIKGIILTSGHRDFMAGADLKFIANPPKDKEGVFKDLLAAHKGFRILEQSQKPFVAAINGNALGGGYELALTCHHRIAINAPKISIGLPETTLGLLPGGGGTQRLSYLIGIPKATQYILQGKTFSAAQAHQEGLIQQLVDPKGDLIGAAKEWILNNPTPIQPWDNKKYRIPQGGVMSHSGVQTLTGSIGNLRKKTHGNYPGAKYALACIHDGMQLPIDRGLEIEARYFIKAFYSKEAQNIIRTAFFAINEAKKGKTKPTGYDFYKINKLGVLGAGMMGAGIAYVSAKAGMEVLLKDTSIENAQLGKDYSNNILQQKLAKGRTTPEKTTALLDNITPTATLDGFENCDLVIEAVYENEALKNTVTKETEAKLASNKVFASNTSTIPITTLARATEHPQNFVGIHFFSPVEKMPLVEIIKGNTTADYAIAAAIDYVTQIGKVPIVVNDSRGFFTSRVFALFIGEGALLLEEGVPPVMIENIAQRVGMPTGPLAVTDEVALTLCLNVLDAAGEAGRTKATQRRYDVYQKVAIEHQRAGRKVGKGFYDYPQGAEKHIWSGLADLFTPNPDYLDGETIGKRMLHIMALESYRCLDEGVLNNTTDGDVGSLLAFGFPAYTGGVFSYIDYVGVATFVAECDDFTERFGERFAVPDSLRAMAERGEQFY